MRKRDRVAYQQARNADARADDRAEGGAEDDQRDYVPDARETRTKSDTPQQIGADEGLERR